MLVRTFLFLCWVGVCRCLKNLDLDQVNVLVVTDVHSWVAGHLPHEPNKDADYGDVLSFYERLTAYCDKNGRDIFFVMNGDFMDGTGLSKIPPKELVPIIQSMPFDAINIGNHELYHNEVIEYITKENGFVESWNKRYLTSNTLLVETNDTIGERYMYLNATNSNSTILTFGFLYNFKNHCDITMVEEVENVVNSTWFVAVLQADNFDAILVLSHFGTQDPLVNVILHRIRQICGDSMPVQFINGHTHVRSVEVPDNHSYAFEPGHYLDTVGFASFPIKQTLNTSYSNSSLFHHHFIDASVASFKEILEEDVLATERGRALSDKIRKTQLNLGLLEVLGCAPQTYNLFSALNNDDSLWDLYRTEVMPLAFDGTSDQLMIQNAGSFRYSLFNGNITVNDMIAVNPFNDEVMLIADEVSGKEFINAFGSPNYVDPNATRGKHSQLPEYITCCDVDLDKKYQIYGVTFDVPYLTKQLENATSRQFNAIGTKTRTADLWKEFIADNFICPVKPAAKKEEERKKYTINDFLGKFTWAKLIGLFLSFMVMSLLGWMFLFRGEPARVRYDGANDFDGESYSSDSGLSYGTRSNRDSGRDDGSENNTIYRSIEEHSII